jgi:hypothetical protein
VHGVRARRSALGRVHGGFGLKFACAFPLAGLPELGGGQVHLEVGLATADEVERRWSGPAPGASPARTVLDGLPYSAERGADGDYRFAYGERALFHLSPDARTLRCAPADADDPAWRRVLLDSVLATVSLRHGFEALHAASVLSPRGAVAFVARSGGGKTTLAVELMRRRLPLVSDDVLALSRKDGQVVGHPAPPVMNLPSGAPAPRGVALASIEDETWLAVDEAADAPAAIAAIFILDRRPGAAVRAVRRDGGVMDLVAHGLRSGDAPERLKARFELLSDLADQAPVFLLEAAPDTPAERLADLAGEVCPALASVAAGAAR